MRDDRKEGIEHVTQILEEAGVARVFGVLSGPSWGGRRYGGLVRETSVGSKILRFGCGADEGCMFAERLVLEEGDP